MLTDLEQDNILDDFAIETPFGPETLLRYIQEYPTLALELTDLYHELLMVDLSAATDGLQLEAKPTVETSQQNLADVTAALSGTNLRNLAKTLGLPRDFIAGFRDRKIRFGSVPGALLTNLAHSASVSLHQLVGYLMGNAGPTPQMAYKADEKPRKSAAVEFDIFVEGLGLNENELEALNRLSVSDGSD
jgi:hypothetical protein